MGSPRGMIIDGVCASEAIDSSGEILSVKGCDISEFEEGKATLNWEHRGEDAPGASANDTVGEIIDSKKIFKESDCDNEQQRKYWRRLEIPFIYIKAELFDGDGHPGAIALAATIRHYKSRNKAILVRYSIEGSTLEKEGNRLVTCVARRVACTIKPCNRTCDSDVLEDPNAPSGSELKQVTKDLLDFEAKKSEDPMYSTLSTFEWECDPEVPLDKALTAGMPSAAPGALIGGAALQTENGRTTQRAMVNQAMAAMRDFGKVKSFNKLAFKTFVKNRLPEASDDFIDHFVDAAEDYEIKRSQLRKDEAEAPKTPKKAPTKQAAKTPKPKAAPVDEEDAGPVKIPNGTIRGIPTQPVKIRGYKFDEANGILHTPKGSFPLYNPDKGFGVVEHPSAKKPFYKDGVLHVAPGTDAAAAGGNLPNPGFRKIYESAPIEEFHSQKVMPNWTRVHELTKAGKLPDEVAMHSAVFSMLSPNTPVRPHELMYAHMADTWEDLGVDPRDPDFKKARKHWMGKDQGTNYPRIAREYFQGHKDVHLSNDSEGKGRKAGELMSFMLGENKFKNIAQYHKLHDTLVDMVKRHGTNARAATAELMGLKHKQELWKQTRRTLATKLKEKGAAELGLKDNASEYLRAKEADAKSKKLIDDRNGPQMRKQWRDEVEKLGLKDDLTNHVEQQLATHPQYGEYKGVPVPGLAPKTGRFTFTMLGGGNSFVPDTHIVRHLFGMDATKDGDTLAYLKSVLWNANNHHILDGIDRWYAKNHPAAQLMQNHPTWGKYFADDKEQANFPAFWRHWCSIAQDERNRGMANSAANEFSTHEPFWEGISKYVKDLKKGELDTSLAARMIGLHTQYHVDHGEVPAQMLYFANIVPHLIEAAQFRQRHDSPHDFIKSETLRLHALDIELRKAMNDMQNSELWDDEKKPSVQSVHMKLDGKEHLAGRFMVLNGVLHHLEDYHGLLARFVPQGPVTLKSVSQIHALKMSPHVRIEREETPQDDSEGGLPSGDGPTIPTAPPRVRPASVFAYHRAGMDKPHTLEVRQGQYLLDGNRLSYPEVSTVISNLRSGAAKLRYRSSEASQLVAKMESAISSLIKAAPEDEEMDPATALQHIRTAVAAGHIHPSVERAMTRHIYEDKMTPGIGNKYAASEFMKNPRPGVHVSMDGNEFREINNKYGHEAGDAAITSFGKAAREAMDEAVGRHQGKLFRNPDEQDLYRNGGDEFVAHVPSHEHAAKFARALSQRLEALPPIGGQHKLSMSFGFGADPHTADKALYMAKEQKMDPATGKRKYAPQAVPNLAHSLVPGQEGALPVHESGASAMHATLKPAPKLPSEPAQPVQPSA